MKKLIVILSLIFLASCQNYQDFVKKYSSYFSDEKQEQEAEFIDGTDIPLFADFVAINDDEMNFDSGLGSISTFKYQSSSDIAKIRNFYLKNMPQLGWELNKMTREKITFVRQKENLTINFNEKSVSTIEVKFFLSSVF